MQPVERAVADLEAAAFHAEFAFDSHADQYHACRRPEAQREDGRVGVGDGESAAAPNAAAPDDRAGRALDARQLPADQQQALLVAPVDMPDLQADGLLQLISSWQQQPTAAAVAHDGKRLQPLLGIYPGGSKQRQSMLETLAAGHNSWMAWLEQIPYRAVSLPPGQLRNCNHPNDDSRAID